MEITIFYLIIKMVMITFYLGITIIIMIIYVVITMDLVNLKPSSCEEEIMHFKEGRENGIRYEFYPCYCYHVTQY